MDEYFCPMWTIDCHGGTNRLIPDWVSYNRSYVIGSTVLPFS